MIYLLMTYLVYLTVMVVIIGWAGWQLHHAGKPFIKEVFFGDVPKADLTNNLLLLGYYLVNIGYSFVALNQLPEVNSAAALIEVLSRQIGLLIILLAALHYCNIALLLRWKRHSTNSSNFF